MTLLEQIESRLALCAKATPGPWEGTMMQAADTGPRLIIVAEDASDEGGAVEIAQVYTREEREFIAASRNQREGELAALKVALEKLNELDQTLRVPAAEYVPAIADAFTIIDQALAQITKLMGEGK